MENFLWSYCLNEEQFTKLYRIICKVPGLLQYLTDHNGRDLPSLILNFKMLVETEGASTLGIRMNLELIKNRYDIFRKEYEDKNAKQIEFDLYHILTWNPKPKWTSNMTVEEIEAKLKGNTCGDNYTSCADQFARAVRQALDSSKK